MRLPITDPGVVAQTICGLVIADTSKDQEILTPSADGMIRIAMI